MAPVRWQGDQVEDRGRELSNRFIPLMGDVAGHRQGFQVNFRSGHGCADVEVNTPTDLGKIAGISRGRSPFFQIVDRTETADAGSENQEVGVARLTEPPPFTVLVRMNDVAADRDMVGRVSSPS